VKQRKRFRSRLSLGSNFPECFVIILTKRITSLDEAAHDPGVVGIPASRDPAGISDGVVKLHHELRRYLAMGQILVLTPNTEDLQCVCRFRAKLR